MTVRMRLFIVAMIFVAGLTHRIPISSLPPLGPLIRPDLGMDNVHFGLLTTIPFFCFSLFANITPWFERHLGLTRTLLMTFVLSLIAYGLRYSGGSDALWLSAWLFGLAIALGNIAVPSLIKAQFTQHLSLLSAVYSASLFFGPGIATAFTLPLVTRLQVSWSTAASLWGLTSLLCLLMWTLFYYARRQQATGALADAAQMGGAQFRPWRSAFAWLIVVYFAGMAALFFIVTAWMPSVIQSAGYPPEEAAGYASLFTFAAIPFALLTAVYVFRTRRQRWATVSAPLLVLAGLALLATGSRAGIVSGMLLMGSGSGICNSVALFLPLLRTRYSVNSTRLNAMVQTVASFIAACGPVLVGWLRDMTHSWQPMLWLLLLVSLLQIACGLVVGRDIYLDPREE